ncbi:MAG: TolC family outer membrane protein [Alphaproteobacteria bacterium]|nr:TolC family outer membrane protein [Alphaproteobacteria bacterium]
MKLVCIARVTTLALFTAMAVSSASAETLTSALASAYVNNPSILAANLAAQASAENIVLAKSAIMPNVGLSAGVSNTSTLAGGAYTGSSSANIGLSYSQTLFDNGRTSASIEAARAGAEAAIESARGAEAGVLLGAAQAYVDVAVNSRIVALRQDTVDFLEAQVQAAKDRLSVGEGTSTEVAQAQAQLAQALADQQGAAADLAVSEANYVRFVGHAPSNLTFDFPFESKLPTSLQNALVLAEANHPDLQSALAQVRSARALAENAQAAFGPSVAVSGRVTDTYGFGTGASSGNAIQTSVGVSLSVPLYAGGGMGANARKTNLQLIQAEMTAQSTHDLIKATLAQAWSSLRTSAATIAAVTAAETATQKVLDAVTEEFGVGQKTQLDVLDAKSSLTTVQITKISAESGRFMAALSLLSAVGRMSATELGLPVEVRTPDAYRAKVEDIWQELRAVPN